VGWKNTPGKGGFFRKTLKGGECKGQRPGGGPWKRKTFPHPKQNPWKKKEKWTTIFFWVPSWKGLLLFLVVKKKPTSFLVRSKSNFVKGLYGGDPCRKENYQKNQTKKKNAYKNFSSHTIRYSKEKKKRKRWDPWKGVVLFQGGGVLPNVFFKVFGAVGWVSPPPLEEYFTNAVKKMATKALAPIKARLPPRPVC